MAQPNTAEAVNVVQNIKENRKEFEEKFIASQSTAPGSNDNSNPASSLVAKYPAKYISEHPLEEKVRMLKSDPLIKSIVDNDDNANGGIIQKPAFDSEVFDLVKQKEAELELRNFEQWIGESFDLNDPITTQYLSKVYPEYFQKRIQLFQSKLSTLNKVVRLQMFGPQNTEDLILQYQLQKGDIDFDNVTNAIDGLNEVKQKEEDLYKPGLFAPSSRRISKDKKGNDLTGPNSNLQLNILKSKKAFTTTKGGAAANTGRANSNWFGINNSDNYKF